MQKVGEFWIPDIDAAPGRNLTRSEIAFSEKQGIHIDHLFRALQLIPERRLAIDGGANVGAWTKVMAKHFAEVHAFEPNPEVFLCLEQNLSDWDIRKNVTAYPKALSDRFEMVSMSTKGTGRTVTGRITGVGNIEGIAIDSLNLPHCSFLKLDVEGYEDKALLGSQETIARCRPWIMIENEPEKLPSHANTPAERILESYQYQLVEKIGDRELDWLYKPT